MKLKTLGCAVALALVAMSAQAGEGPGKHGKPKPFKGCYEVVKGFLDESPAGGVDVVGTYQLVLEQQGNARDKRKRIDISGPMAGREDLVGHTEGDEEEGEEIHGKHFFGMYDRSGVIVGHETASQRLGQDCFNPVTNRYDLIRFQEIMEIDGGSGAFSGITEGDIIFKGTLDRCTDPSNPLLTFDEISGDICFGEEGEGHED